MVKLSGLTVKDQNNPYGDIEIHTTGLRPGEKLFEELLIDGKSEPTAHPLIFKVKTYRYYVNCHQVCYSFDDQEAQQLHLQNVLVIFSIHVMVH